MIKILIVERFQNYHQIYQLLFKPPQFHLHIINSYEKARHVIKHYTFDLVISELNLTEYDTELGLELFNDQLGLELFNDLNDIDPNIPKILISSEPNPLPYPTLLKYRVFDLIVKPFKREDFYRSVETSLNNKNKVFINYELKNIDNKENDIFKDEKTQFSFSHSYKNLPFVFIAYAKEDESSVVSLYKKLINVGIDAWYDEKRILPGQKWKSEIRRALQQADYIILCLSNNSITKKGYFQKEIKMALELYDEFPENTIYLIPIRLEECAIPDRISDIHYIDFFKNNGFEKLINAINMKRNI